MTRRAARRAQHGRPRPDQEILLALLLDLVAAHGMTKDAHGHSRHPATVAALAGLIPTGADETARAALAARLVLRPLALDLLRDASEDREARSRRSVGRTRDLC